MVCFVLYSFVCPVHFSFEHVSGKARTPQKNKKARKSVGCYGGSGLSVVGGGRGINVATLRRYRRTVAQYQDGKVTQPNGGGFALSSSLSFPLSLSFLSRTAEAGNSSKF